MNKVKCLKSFYGELGDGLLLTIGEEYETHPSENNKRMFYIVHNWGERLHFYNFGSASTICLPGREKYRTEDFLEEVEKSYYHTAVCKGSWSLGTACGRCQRCKDTKADFDSGLPQMSSDTPMPPVKPPRKMIEVRKPVHPYRVRAYCVREHCEGELIATGQVLRCHPPKYRHECEACGTLENLKERYPLIRYEE